MIHNILIITLTALLLLLVLMLIRSESKRRKTAGRAARSEKDFSDLQTGGDYKQNFMTRLQSDLLSAASVDDVLRLVPEAIKDLIGEGIVMTSKINAEGNAFRFSSIAGLNVHFSRIIELCGFDPAATEYRISDMTPEKTRIYNSGRLERIEDGLYSITMRKIPRTVSRMIESLIGYHEVYAMGFTLDGIHYGGLTIISNHQAGVHKESIENIVKYAAVILHGKRTLTATRERENLYMTLFRKSPISISITTPFEGRFLDVNDKFLDEMDYLREEVIGKTTVELGVFAEPGDRDRLIGILKKKGSVEGFESVFRSKSGRLIPGLLSVVFAEISGSPAQITTVIDISDRRKAEERLNQSREFLSEMIENSGAVIYVKSCTGHYEMVNQKWEEVTGLPRQKVIGRSDMELFHEDIARQFRTNDLDVINEEKTIRQEELLPRDGKMHYFISIKFPVRNPEGGISGVCGMSTDITEIKQYQLELITLKGNLEKIVEERTHELTEKITKLHESQKAMLYMVEDLNEMTAALERERQLLEFSNRELESFSYTVSHDLRAPLRAIDGFTRILSEDHTALLDEEGKRICGNIRRNTQNMGQLIDDLLQFSRLSRIDFHISDVDMQQMVIEVYHDLTSPESRNRISFHADKLCAPPCDPAMIRHIWLNLISNAIKFSNHRKKPEVHISCTREEDYCVYCVRDNGVGFDMQYYDKLFGVFQRLHSRADFEGTGVGLAIVQRIAQRHGGKAWAKGNPGKGAEFFFSLPHKIH